MAVVAVGVGGVRTCGSSLLWAEQQQSNLGAFQTDFNLDFLHLTSHFQAISATLNRCANSRYRLRLASDQASAIHKPPDSHGQGFA